MPFGIKPWGSDPWGTSSWGLGNWGEQFQFILTFTNTGADITPYIVVSGSPDILWTWSDGSTDTKANPDDKTLTGTHTLFVNPWSDLTSLRFESQSLTGSFVTQTWSNLKQLRVPFNSLSSTFVTYPWENITYLYIQGNSFSSLFNVHPWTKLLRLYFFANSISQVLGSFKTQLKMEYFYAYSNDIASQSEIDKILSDLVVNAADAGRTAVCAVRLEGGTNATPSAAGQADADTLVTTYGWTVTTN